MDSRFDKNKEDEYDSLRKWKKSKGYIPEYKRIKLALLPFTKSKDKDVVKIAEKMRTKLGDPKGLKGCKNNPILIFTSKLNNIQVNNLAEYLIGYIIEDSIDKKIIKALFKNRIYRESEDIIMLDGTKRCFIDPITIKNKEFRKFSFLLDVLRAMDFLTADHNGFWAHISSFWYFNKGFEKTSDIPSTAFSNSSRDVYNLYFKKRYKKNPTKNQKEYNMFFKDIERIIREEIPKKILGDFKKKKKISFSNE